MSGTASDELFLNGRYQLQAQRPQPALASPGTEAFGVTDLRLPKTPLFALACQQNLLPRLDVIPVLSRFERVPLLCPVFNGVVSWPGGGRRYVVVLNHPGGERLQKIGDSQLVKMREDEIVRVAVRSLLPVLKELSGRQITHRGIRADNLFFSDLGRRSLVLGECVSAPPGMHQPVIYEPIDSAMSDASSRGPGSLPDDLYSFGALLAMLVTGGDSVVGIGEEELVERKLTLGSYATLIGDARISLTMMEPLRGLLCDDPKERWTTDDVAAWLNGRHLSPKQPMLPQKAARAIVFAGKELMTIPQLSLEIGRHWTEATEFIKRDDINAWLKRSLDDEDTAASVDMARREGEIGGGAAAGDRAVARVLIALDPKAPLRYKGLAVRPDGLGQALAIHYHDDGKRQILGELIAGRLPQAWLDANVAQRGDTMMMRRRFESMTSNIDKPRIGYGVERALYEANPSWPCQSPYLADDFVIEIGEMLPALERVAARTPHDREPMDLHVAAFCAARLKGISDRTLNDLADKTSDANRRLAQLRLLAAAQSHGEGAFPAVAAWIAKLADPLVERLHNRDRRMELRRKMERFVARGNLVELYVLFDNPEMLALDQQEFATAQQLYLALEKQSNWLEDGGLTSRAHIATRSRRAATAVSSVLSSLTLLLLTLHYVT